MGFAWELFEKRRQLASHLKKAAEVDTSPCCDELKSLVQSPTRLGSLPHPEYHYCVEDCYVCAYTNLSTELLVQPKSTNADAANLIICNATFQSVVYVYTARVNVDERRKSVSASWKMLIALYRSNWNRFRSPHPW